MSLTAHTLSPQLLPYAAASRAQSVPRAAMNGETATGLTAAGLTAGDSEYVMEYQIESERGFHFMGKNLFTSNMRLPHDPAHFTSVTGEPLADSLTDFEVPDDSWVWVWSRWYADMTTDVDDQGWCYASNFNSVHWSGRHRIMRSFVRQRVWKRPRVKCYLLTPDKNARDEADLDDLQKTREKYGQYPVDKYTGAQIEHEIRMYDDEESDWMSEKNHILKRDYEESVRENEDYNTELYRKRQYEQEITAILDHINTFRNDREKVDGIVAYIGEHPEQHAMLVHMRDQLVGQLSFNVSKRSLVTKLSESQNENCRLFLLAPTDTWRDLVLQRGEPEWETRKSVSQVKQR